VKVTTTAAGVLVTVDRRAKILRPNDARRMARELQEAAARVEEMCAQEAEREERTRRP
jgi:hypothetical protein